MKMNSVFFLLRPRYILFISLFSYIIVCQSCMTMRMNLKETNLYFTSSKVVFINSTIEVNGHSIHYIETGNAHKPTLFFVHGSPGSWDAYKTYLTDTLLLNKYRMIAIDRPGFGYSNFGHAENLQTQSKIIQAFIVKIDNGKPIILIGHSLGGPVVVKMATEKSNFFKNIVVLSGAIDPEAEKPELWRPFFIAKPLRYLVPGALRPSNDELWWLKKDLYDLKSELKKITATVTIIHGTKDPLVPFENVVFMKREFANAQSIQTFPIENANHFIPWEHFQLIRNTLLNLKLQN